MGLTIHGGLQGLLAMCTSWVSASASCQGESAVQGMPKAALDRSILAASQGEWHNFLVFLQATILVCVLTFTCIIVISLIVRMITLTMLAGESMGRKGMAATAVKMSFVCSHALRAAAFFSCILCLLDLSGMAFYPSIRDWGYFSISMLFTLLLIAATSYSLLKKEEQLRIQFAVSEESYRLLFERSLVGSYKAALDGRILDCNFSFCQIFGYESRAEVVDNSINVGYFKPEDRDRFNCWLQAKKQLTNFEQCLRRRDGGSAWILNTATLVTAEAGREPFIKGTMTDISELRLELPAWLRRATKTPLAVARWSVTDALRKMGF